jgi:hypothetical protein
MSTLERFVVTIALVVAGVAVVAHPAAATAPRQSPDAEQVRSWATTLPRQSISRLDPVYRPIDAIHVVDSVYAGIVQDFSEARPGAAWTKGGEGSRIVDRYRRVLVHSPDRNLNRLMNRALNRVGDVFDAISVADSETAADLAPASNRPWAEVEATLKADGVDTGPPWSLSTVS